jgi:hypothetical protein
MVRSPLLQTFLDHHNSVVATIRVASGNAKLHFDAARASAHPATPDATHFLGNALRALGYENTPDAGVLARFALGFAVARAALVQVLPPDVISGLTASGLAADLGPRVRLYGAVLAAESTLVFVRRDGEGSDRVYLGDDSLLLLDAVRHLTIAGARSADLGTGTGLVAACLARTYRVVVATDLLDGLVGGALVTAGLTPSPPGHRVVGCVADVGSALRPEAFDFVAANTPWVPSEAARATLHADGGPTGMELPSRFVTEGTRLLRPGGAGVFLLTDITFSDRDPPLQELCHEIAEGGVKTWVLPTPYLRCAPTWDQLAARVPGGASARHVALIVARPPVAPTFLAGLSRLRQLWSEA